MKKNNSRRYVVMWCCEGLECIIPIKDQNERDMVQMEKILTDDEVPDSYEQSLSRTLFALDLRARANTHRHYEIYVIHTDPSIGEDLIKDQFDHCPQQIVDLIRERGTKIYSDRASTNSRIL